MKNTKLLVPLSMTAALVGLVAGAVSCAKKNNNPETAPPGTPPATNSVTDNTTPGLATNAAASATASAETNANPQEITTPPPAETTTQAPATSQTNLPEHVTVVEMPTNTPAAPTNFYPASMVGNTSNMHPVAEGGGGILGGTNLFVQFRAGYEHIYHGDNNDSYFVSAKLYAYGDGLRQSVGPNGWLIPDVEAELSSGVVAKPDSYRHRGSDSGMAFRAGFTWPWFHWTTLLFNRNDSVCPFCRPLAMGLGPTVNVGFDHLYDETEFRFARYAGVRLTINRDCFIEYTAGGTDGLSGTRQQVVAELPLYESRDGEVRYYIRGLWNRGETSKPDILEAGLYLEMPFSTFVRPEKWGDLIPFWQ